MHFFAAKLLSIAYLTYTYADDVRNLHPIIRLIYYAHCTQRINFNMRQEHVR